MTDVAAASAQVRASSSGLHTSSGLADNPAPSLQYLTALGLPSGPSHLSTLLNTSLSPIRHPAYGDFGETDSLMAQHFLGSSISSNPTGSLPFALSTQLTNSFFSASQRGSMPPTMALGSQQQQRHQIVDNALQQQLPWQQLQGQQQQGQTQLQQQAQSNLQQQYMQQQSLQHHQMLQQLQQHEQQGQGQHQMPAAALTQLQQMQHQSRVQALDHERAMMQQQQQHDFELQTARQGQSACNLQHTVSSRQLEVLLQLSGLSSVLQRLQLGASLPRK